MERIIRTRKECPRSAGAPGSCWRVCRSTSSASITTGTAAHHRAAQLLRPSDQGAGAGRGLRRPLVNLLSQDRSDPDEAAATHRARALRVSLDARRRHERPITDEKLVAAELAPIRRAARAELGRPVRSQRSQRKQPRLCDWGSVRRGHRPEPWARHSRASSEVEGGGGGIAMRILASASPGVRRGCRPAAEDAAPASARPSTRRRPRRRRPLPRCRSPRCRRSIAAEVLDTSRCCRPTKFEGRAPGTKGEELTVKFLEDAFTKIGLKPGNTDGTSFSPCRSWASLPPTRGR